MRKEERLFAALSGVDEELLARSERKKSGGRRWRRVWRWQRS